MLVAASYSLNFTLYFWQKSFRRPFFYTLLFSAPFAGTQQGRRIKGRRVEGGEIYKAFKLGIYSIGHTLFTNWHEHRRRLRKKGGPSLFWLNACSITLSLSRGNKCCPKPFISSSPSAARISLCYSFPLSKAKSQRITGPEETLAFYYHFPALICAWGRLSREDGALCSDQRVGL